MSDVKLVNVSVASIYSDCSFKSEVVTQACLGEELNVLEDGDKWVHIRQQDVYEGWIDAFHLASKPTDWDRSPRYMTNDQVAFIHESPDASSTSIRDVTLVSELPLLKRENGWVQVRLPDDKQGWLLDHPRERIEYVDPEMLIATATRFLGIQYLWGGRTPKGFDCSGFVQTVFALNGIKLPRDSYMQAEVGLEVGNDWQDWEAGDLVFFSFFGGRVTHVGIVIGNGDIIHASGFVRIESLNETRSELYSPGLCNAFVKASRILGKL